MTGLTADLVLAPATGKALPVVRGQLLRLEQVADGQCVDLNVFNLRPHAGDPRMCRRRGDPGHGRTRPTPPPRNFLSARVPSKDVGAWDRAQQALLNKRPRNRPCEVQAPPHSACGGQQLVSRKGHADWHQSTLHLPQPAADRASDDQPAGYNHPPTPVHAARTRGLRDLIHVPRGRPFGAVWSCAAR
jgi:hypothetical protein